MHDSGSTRKGFWPVLISALAVQVGDAFMILLKDLKATGTMLRVMTEPCRIEEVALEAVVKRMIKQLPEKDS